MERSQGHQPHAYDSHDADTGRQFASNLIRTFLQQVFEHGFFHGDPHPGNVFLLDDGRLCFHDFGIVGTLVGDDQENLAQLILGVAVRDAQWVAGSYFAMGVAGPDVDRQAFTRDAGDALAAFYAGVGRGPAFSEILRQFIRLGRRHRIRLPRENSRQQSGVDRSKLRFCSAARRDCIFRATSVISRLGSPGMHRGSECGLARLCNCFGS